MFGQRCLGDCARREGARRGEAGVRIIRHGHVPLIIGPRIPTKPARSTSGFLRPGGRRAGEGQAGSDVHCVFPSNNRRYGINVTQAVVVVKGCGIDTVERVMDAFPWRLGFFCGVS